METGHVWEAMVVLSTIALTLVTLLLTWATWKMYKASITEMSHANDNATEVALAEIESHNPGIQIVKVIPAKREGRKHSGRHEL